MSANQDLNFIDSFKAINKRLHGPANVKAKNLLQLVYSKLLDECILIKQKLGYRPRKEDIDSKPKFNLDFAKVHQDIVASSYYLRQTKRFAKALALEALVDRLGNKSVCSVIGDRTEKIQKFERFDAILLLLLKLSNLKETELSPSDSLELLPMAKFLVTVILQARRAKNCADDIELNFLVDLSASSLDPKKPKEGSNPQDDSHVWAFTQAYKKLKLNPTKQFYENNISRSFFNLGSGPLIPQEWNYTEIKTSSLGHTNSLNYTLYNKENFEMKYDIRNQAKTFVEKNNSSLGIFKLNKPTTDAHQALFGSLQHTQKTTLASFNINLEIPPLPTYEPNGNHPNCGLAAFAIRRFDPQPLTSRILPKESELTFTLASEKNKEIEEATRKSNRFKDSIFSDPSKIANILENRPDFEISNLWEDYGKSRNDNRFKNLKIAPCGLMTKDTAKNLIESFEKSRENPLSALNEILPESYYIHHVVMALMGLSGGLYDLDKNSLEFYLTRCPKRTQYVTNETLFAALDKYCCYATFFIRVSRLVSHVRSQSEKSLSKMSFYHVVEQFVNHYTQNLIELKEECETLLQLEVSLEKTLNELKMVYQICFGKEQMVPFGENYNLEDYVSSASELLDFTYTLLHALELPSHQVEMIHHIFTQAVRPFLDNLSDFSFRGESNPEDRDFLFEFKSEWNEYFIVQKVRIPICFEKIVYDVLVLGNNMHLLKEYEHDYYLACKDYELRFKLCYSTAEMYDFEVSIQSKYKEKTRNVEMMDVDLKIEKERRNFERLQKRLIQLRKIKEEMELEAKKKQDAMEDEKAKKENYRAALRQQQNQQKILEKLQKEIEKENERAFLLDLQLKEKEQMEIEKKKLIAKLKEINGVTTPKRERYEILMSEKKKREAERTSKWENRDPNSTKNLASQQQSTISKTKEEGKQDMLIEPTPQRPSHEMMMIENTPIDLNQQILSDYKTETPNKSDRVIDTNKIQPFLEISSNKMVDESKFKDEIITKKDDIMKEEPKFEDQEIIPKEGEEKQKMRSQWSKKREENISNEPIRIDNDLIAVKSPSEWLRASKQPIQYDVQKLTEEDESSKTSNIPVDTSMQICVRNLIRLQLDLTNKAMMQIIKEKYKLLDAFKLLKSFMFGEKGDRLDSYTELLFKETSAVNWNAVFHANSYFEDKASYVDKDDTHEFNLLFKLKQSKAVLLPHTIQTFDFSQHLSLEFEGPSLLKHVITQNSLAKYTEVFSVLIKFRYLSLLLRGKWKVINQQILLLKENRRYAKHAQAFRHEAQNFLNYLQEYFYINIIEGSWKHFVNKINKASNFYDIREIHSNYLDNIMRKCFIRSSFKNVDIAYNRIISLIMQFHGIISQVSQTDVLQLKVLNFVEEVRQLESNFKECEKFISMVFQTVIAKQQQTSFLEQANEQDL